MTYRNKLWYLINEFERGNYDITVFCDEFYRIFNFEDDGTLSESEEIEFQKLFEIIGRFSEFPEDLELKNVYYNEAFIRNSISQVSKKFNLIK